MTSPNAKPMHWAAYPFFFIGRHVKRQYKNFLTMGPVGKGLLCFLVLFYTSVIVGFFAFGPANVTQKMYDLSQALRRQPAGWLILLFIMVLSSIPPMVGHLTSITLFGFGWGLTGFWFAAAGVLLGSATSFILLRLLFIRRLRNWSGKNVKWQALEAVIRAKGLPLVCLIRLCPLPWVYNNAFFASVESVSFGQFIFATVLLLPKTFLSVFVGSRVARLSDGQQREEMDTTTKVINTLSIVFAAVLGGGVGIYVYRVTQAKIRAMEGLPDETTRLAAEEIEDLEEAEPLIEGFSLEEPIISPHAPHKPATGQPESLI